MHQVCNPGQPTAHNNHAHQLLPWTRKITMLLENNPFTTLAIQQVSTVATRRRRPYNRIMMTRTCVITPSEVILLMDKRSSSTQSPRHRRQPSLPCPQKHPL